MDLCLGEFIGLLYHRYISFLMMVTTLHDIKISDIIYLSACHNMTKYPLKLVCTMSCTRTFPSNNAKMAIV